MRKLEVEKSRVRILFKKAINMVRKNIEKRDSRQQNWKAENRRKIGERTEKRGRRKYWINMKMRRVRL